MSVRKAVSKHWAAVGLLPLLFSVAAGAAQGRTVGDILKKIEKRAETVKLKKTKSNLPKFRAQKKEQPRNINLRAVKPPSSSKLYYDEGTDEAELQKITDQGIKQLYNLTRRYKRSTRRGELWLRLAELYVEKARLIEFQIQEKYDKDMAAFMNGKTKRRPKLNLEPSFVYNRKAIQLYEWFIRDFPKDPKMDQALFFLGYNHFEIGNVKKGEGYYLRLSKEYPKSNYVDESNFALGEYYFENEKYKEAAPFYARVARKKRNRLYSFGLYKLAWCQYKLRNTKQGLKYLEEVILEGRRSKARDKSATGVSRIRLATEAIKDLILFYADVGDPQKARGYFEDVVGPKSTNANLSKLAQYYMDTGNRSAATYLFKDLISDQPKSIKAFDYQQNIVKMYQSAGGRDNFKRELYTWIEVYGPNGDWQQANRKEAKILADATNTIESTLRNYVLQQHQTAQNTRIKSAQLRAKDGYELYLSSFKESPKLDEMHFFYGELLFDMQDYEKAAYQYNWVVENAPKSTYADKALLNTLLAVEKRLPSEKEIKKMVGDSTDPQEFPPAVALFDKVARRYFAKSPNGENVVAIKYRLGALHYYFNQYDPALGYFREIVKKYPTTEYARYSANLILDIYNLKKDYVGLQAAAEDILKIPALAKSDVGTQIASIKVQTDFKLAKDLEDKKDFEKSADAYRDFSQRHRSSPLAFTALYNAAVNYERVGRVGDAIGMYEVAAAAKGKVDPKLKYNAAKFLPPLYQRTGQYLRAADHFESFANHNPKDSVANEYHFNAGVIYDGMNMYSKAIRNYQKYYDTSKKADRFEALFLQAKMYERMKSWTKAVAFYDKYLNSGTANGAGVVEAAFSIAKIHDLRRKKKYADEWYEKTVGIHLRLSRQGRPAGTSFAAEAKFNLVKNTYDDFVRIRIPAAGKAQGAAVQKKLALLNRLKEELKSVVKYDDAFQIVAALNLQGKALEHMYAALIKAPVPKGLKPDELKTYREGVAKVADPFKAQAIETYDLAVTRGYELQAYSPDLANSIARVTVLKGQAEKDLNPNVRLTSLPDWMEAR